MHCHNSASAHENQHWIAALQPITQRPASSRFITDKSLQTASYLRNSQEMCLAHGVGTRNPAVSAAQSSLI